MKNRYKPIGNGYYNEVFFDPDTKQVFRVSSEDKKEISVKQELEWVNYLYLNGVPVPRLLKVEKWEGKLVIAMEYIEGESMDVTNPSHWNPEVFQKIGKILGKMHALSKKYNKVLISRPRWTRNNPDVYGINDFLSPEMKKTYYYWLSKLNDFETTEDNFGLIHNDFHQGNFIIRNNGNLTVIDFDDCSYNWFAQDFAVLFYHAYWQQNSFNGLNENFTSQFFSNLVFGYKKENNLPVEILKQIPIFLKLREIYLYQLFKRKWNMNSLAEWQDFTLRDLEKKIFNKDSYAGIKDFSIFS